MSQEDTRRTSGGVAFLVAAGLMMEAIAAYCSSPQTTEINANKRSDTLMKWVNIGTGTGVILVVIAAVHDQEHRSEILSGGLLSAGALYGSYVLAKRWGLADDQPGTETY